MNSETAPSFPERAYPPSAFAAEDVPPSLKIVPTAFPTSPPIENALDRFYSAGPELEAVNPQIAPPERWLELLEELGPSPFERGGFPVIGFLASTYEKVSRFALERNDAEPPERRLLP